MTPLLQAAAAGRLDEVDVALAGGAHVDSVEAVGWTALHAAALGGHLDIVERLLAAGANPNGTLPEGWTPLMAAALRGHAAVVSALLVRGADASRTVGAEKFTALSFAAALGHTDVIAAFDRAGLRPTTEDAVRYHIAQITRQGGQVCCVEAGTTEYVMVSQVHPEEDYEQPHPDIYQVSGVAHREPVRIGDIAEFRGSDAPIENEAEPRWVALGEWKDLVGEAERAAKRLEVSSSERLPSPPPEAAVIAATRGDVASLRSILSLGTRPTGEAAATALVGALRAGSNECFQLLLEAGLDVNAQTPGGRTALHEAIARANMVAVRRLLDRGARTDVVDGNGTAAVIAAAASPHASGLDMLSALLERQEEGARYPGIDTMTKDGTTALLAAIWRGAPGPALALLDVGADPKQCDARGRSALSFAVQKESMTQVVEVLLEGGADPNQRVVICDGPEEEPALSRAASLACAGNVAALLDHGADVNATDAHGRTAIYRALEQCGAEVTDALGPAGPEAYTTIELLIACGADLSHRDAKGQTPAEYAADFCGAGSRAHELVAKASRP